MARNSLVAFGQQRLDQARRALHDAVDDFSVPEDKVIELRKDAQHAFEELKELDRKAAKGRLFRFPQILVSARRVDVAATITSEAACSPPHPGARYSSQFGARHWDGRRIRRTAADGEATALRSLQAGLLRRQPFGTAFAHRLDRSNADLAHVIERHRWAERSGFVTSAIAVAARSGSSCIRSDPGRPRLSQLCQEGRTR